MNLLKSGLGLLVLCAAFVFSTTLVYPLQLIMLLLGISHSKPLSMTEGNISIAFMIAISIYWLLIYFSKDFISPLDRLFDRIVAKPNCLPNGKDFSPGPTKLQWILGLLAIVALAASGWLPSANAYLDSLVLLRNAFPSSNVVYATKFISRGSYFTPDAIEVRRILDYNLPVYLETCTLSSSKQDLEGRAANIPPHQETWYSVAKRQLRSLWSLP